MPASTAADLAGLRVAWVRAMMEAYRESIDPMQGSVRALVALRQMPDEARIELAAAMLPAGWSLKPAAPRRRRAPQSDPDRDGWMLLLGATRGPR